MAHPCLNCGACCAHFRVSFHWSEAAPELGGQIPLELTEPLRSHERAMRGTSQSQPRCIALDAEIGRHSRCRIHPLRPNACRDVFPSLESGQRSRQCDLARQPHGLPPIQASDWLEEDRAVAKDTPGSATEAAIG